MMHPYLLIQISMMTICDELSCIGKDGQAHHFDYNEPNGKDGELYIEMGIRNWRTMNMCTTVIAILTMKRRA